MSTSAMSYYRANAKFIIKENKLEMFKEAVEKIISPTRKEVGALKYEAYQVLNDEGRESRVFEFDEIWRTHEDLKLHIETRHMRDFFEEIKWKTKESYVESSEFKGTFVKVLGEDLNE